MKVRRIIGGTGAWSPQFRPELADALAQGLSEDIELIRLEGVIGADSVSFRKGRTNVLISRGGREYGTIEAVLEYNSPTGITVACQDLEGISHRTGWGFCEDVTAILGEEHGFKEWSIYRSTVPRKADKAGLVASIQFPCPDMPRKRERELRKIADRLYKPIPEQRDGQIIYQVDCGDGSKMGGPTPIWIAQKRWKKRDVPVGYVPVMDYQISDFFDAVKGFEQRDAVGSSNEARMELICTIPYKGGMLYAKNDAKQDNLPREGISYRVF